MSTTTSPATTSHTLGPVDDIKEKLADLQNKLLTSHPLIPSLLRTIHTQLRADPEVVTLLEESEIHTLFKGLEFQTGVKLLEVSKPKKKSLKQMTLDDL